VSLISVGISATTTILFSDFEMDAAAFAFGIISLLSSLMATGFGVGLMYVLGDVDGHTLKVRTPPQFASRSVDTAHDLASGYCASLS
jgi:hypothetical protein